LLTRGRAADERRQEAWPQRTAFPEQRSGYGAWAPLSDWRLQQAKVDITAVCGAAERATDGTPTYHCDLYLFTVVVRL